MSSRIHYAKVVDTDVFFVLVVNYVALYIKLNILIELARISLVASEIKLALYVCKVGAFYLAEKFVVFVKCRYDVVRLRTARASDVELAAKHIGKLLETEYLALVPAQECEEDGLYIYKVIVEDCEEYIEPIEDDKEFEEISETFEDRLSEVYDFE